MGNQVLPGRHLMYVCALLCFGCDVSEDSSWELVEPAEAVTPNLEGKVLHLSDAKILDLQTFSDISPSLTMVVKNGEYRRPYTATEEAYVRKVQGALIGAPGEFVLIRMDESFLGRVVTLECPTSDFVRWRWRQGHISCGGTGVNMEIKFENIPMFKSEGPTWIFVSADGDSFLKLKGRNMLHDDGVMDVVPFAVREPQ